MTCFWISMLAICLLVQDTVGFEMTIIHTNDVQSRFEETNQKGNDCTEKDRNENTCIGGFARMKSFIGKERDKHKHVLTVDAGGQYKGSTLFYMYGGSIVATFMNIIGYDAMCLGNHEFDRRPKGLLPLLDNVKFPIVGTNINATLDPYLKGRIKMRKIFTYNSTVYDKKGAIVGTTLDKVAVIGYTTPKTVEISNPGDKITFYDEIESIQQEVDRLEALNITKIIALGHSGIEKDMELAKKVKGVDIVVGGRSNTFLYNGTAPSTEKPEGPYPRVVTRSDGSKVLVVQAYRRTKYVGVLNVAFNASGHIESWDGNPVLMDSTIKQDADVLSALEPYRKNVSEFTKQTVGRTYVKLNADDILCKRRECNIGNVITDAMVWKKLSGPTAFGWSNVAVAVINGGSIGQSIAQGHVTMQDIFDVLPYQSSLEVVTLKGKFLKEVFDYASSKYSRYFGGFLQVSGIKVRYAVYKPVGQRVQELLVRCHDCDVPDYQAVQDEKIYPIVTSSFLARGGDGFTVFRDRIINQASTYDLISDILAEYLIFQTITTTGLERRITVVDESIPWCLCWSNQNRPCPSSNTGPLASFSLLSLLFCVVMYI